MDSRVVDAARAALASGRLNVCSAATDPQSAEVRARIETAIAVSAFAELEELVAEVEAIGPFKGKPVTLDLVFHSKEPDFVIVLSDGEIRTGDPALERFVTRHATSLAELNVKTVRLLGCRTACSKVGKDTIADLAARLRVACYGTVDVILGGDFTDYGFKDSCSSRLYPDSDGDPPLDLGSAARVANVRLDALRNEVPQVPGPTFIDHQGLSAHLDGDWRSMPGLLVQPHANFVLASDDRSHRVEVLLSNQLVRVYPPGLPAGAVCRVNSPERFGQWLSDQKPS